MTGQEAIAGFILAIGVGAIFFGICYIIYRSFRSIVATAIRPTTEVLGLDRPYPRPPPPPPLDPHIGNTDVVPIVPTNRPPWEIGIKASDSGDDIIDETNRFKEIDLN